MIKFLLALGASIAVSFQALAADVSQPIVSDSRIKTFVYNENEVYTILTQYGYQSHIEFGRSEEIQTISVGDRVAWQIIPAGRRLFIQTMQDNAQTNLTVVTDRHAYQFDLRSTKPTARNQDKLVYVARFYYPDEDWDTPEPMAAPDSLLQATVSSQYNFNYTFAGPDNLAPVKIFDDGHSTFFQFPGGAAPNIAVVTPDGREMPVRMDQQDGYMVVSTVAPQFAVRQGNTIVCVFNEKMRGR